MITSFGNCVQMHGNSEWRKTRVGKTYFFRAADKVTEKLRADKKNFERYLPIIIWECRKRFFLRKNSINFMKIGFVPKLTYKPMKNHTFARIGKNER